ncbi:hypothetical protein B0H17DRAFT_1197533 [Mycena rosella]|uniref:Uncharacterized protein n=1 Tax=Mycena rosella TaxID=1033263 RepID=A0AAD7DRS3_MYCRO|nr:hypothetical protein B0H17DRAFT_1197533 [Mycena rosella]
MIQVGSILSLAATVIATFPTTLVYQSPTGLYLENIAVRPCSKLLLTSALSTHLAHTRSQFCETPLSMRFTASPTLPLFSASSNTNRTSTQWSPPTRKTSFRPPRESRQCRHLARRFPLEDPHCDSHCGHPQSTLINGLSSVPGHPDLVLAADSDLGAAYEITMSTGAVRIAIQDAAMAPGAPAPALGINGLHIHGSALYFTNSQQGTFARIPIAVESKA